MCMPRRVLPGRAGLRSLHGPGGVLDPSDGGKMRIRFLGALVVVTLVWACGGPSAEEQRAAANEARLAARADSVARAAATYDAAAFDTIQWPSDNDMWERGGVVWSFSC